MIEDLARNLVELKNEFAKSYDGKSQIQEIIPKSNSELFPITDSHLESLHQFATKNPIYYDFFERRIGSVDCIVYEGDINKFWLNSIQHISSKAPFSPTWIMSGYIATSFAKELGYSEVVDIGSGDGRMAFCARILNMESYSIEIDETLVELQKLLCDKTDFHPYCSDSAELDYGSFDFKRPIFFIGGLAQMGGTALAEGVLRKINSISHLKNNSGWVFAGTYSQKYARDPKNEAGWGTLIEKNNLKAIRTVSLPTAWTFHEPEPTPYIFSQSI